MLSKAPFSSIPTDISTSLVRYGHFSTKTTLQGKYFQSSPSIRSSSRGEWSVAQNPRKSPRYNHTVWLASLYPFAEVSTTTYSIYKDIIIN